MGASEWAFCGIDPIVDLVGSSNWRAGFGLMDGAFDVGMFAGIAPILVGGAGQMKNPSLLHWGSIFVRAVLLFRDQVVVDDPST